MRSKFWKFLLVVFLSFLQYTIVSAQANAVDAAVYANGHSYLFQGDHYFRFTNFNLDEGYPRKINWGWKGLTTSFKNGIDAALYYPATEKIYFFKGNEYVRITGNRVDPGYPKTLPGGWLGLPESFQSGIDAAIFEDGHTYFFKGKQYVRFTGFSLDDQYPSQLPGGWKISGMFHDNIDAAFNLRDKNKNYLFKGTAYERLIKFKSEVNYPKSLPGGWTGLKWSFVNDDYGEGFVEGKHIIFYFDKDQSYQYKMYLSLKDDYKMISKTISDGPFFTKFATVWVESKDANIPSFTVQGEANFQKQLNKWVPKGYYPALLSISGSDPSLAIYSGTMEQSDLTKPSPMVRHNISEDSLVKMMNWATKHRYIPKTITRYGNLSDPKYAASWMFNERRILWEYGRSDSYTEFRKRYLAHRTHKGRPAIVTSGYGGVHHSVFQNDNMSPWLQWIDIGKDQLVDKINEGLASGYVPMSIESYRVSSAPRYSIFLAQRLEPLAPKFTKTGSENTSFILWDDAIEQVMKDFDIKAGSLAVVYKGRLVHARGFTNAWEDYPITQPTSLFRTASVSKIITSIAVHQLIEAGRFTKATYFKDFIPSEVSSGENDRYNDITIGHVLSHTATFRRSHGFSRSIAKNLGVDLPITIEQKRSWCRKRTLLDSMDVGQKYAYSNLGYTLLGQLIEETAGQSYFNYAKQHILSRLGLSRPQIGRASGDAPGEVQYQPYSLDLVGSAFDMDETLVSRAFDGRDYALTLSSGGWTASTVDLAKLLAAFHSNVDNPLLLETSENSMLTPTVSMGFGGFYETYGWPTKIRNKITGGTVRIFSKGGASSTTAATVQSREDDISFVLLFNKSSASYDPYTGSLINYLHDLADQMDEHDFPNHDLFPSYGVPSF
ncbi:MAG: serine hydrolase [Bacteroidota bacterium]